MDKVIDLNTEKHSHLDLFGPGDCYLRQLAQSLKVKVSARGRKLTISGEKDNIQLASAVINKMQQHLQAGRDLNERDIENFISSENSPHEFEHGGLTVYSHSKIIRPNTAGQDKYIKTILSNDLTFCTGPAGTGKTYLAVGAAVSILKQKKTRKIILARPAVEAGEKLGFLPGDLQAKVNPYLRPLFDAIGDMMSFSQMKKLIDLDIIEIIPLAFMRGRTFNEAVIICDEAQNTSPSQMLMVLTRLGRGSKMIITGDTTQVDLGPGTQSGMVEAMNILRGIEGIGTISLDKADIVRHSLVQNIVTAYNRKSDESITHCPEQCTKNTT